VIRSFTAAGAKDFFVDELLELLVDFVEGIVVTGIDNRDAVYFLITLI
jgi:hypothetical protein